MSTNFNVIQAQRDLAVARNDELQAQLDYQLALIAFNTVQRIGGALSGAIQNVAPVGGINAVSGALNAVPATNGPGGGQ